MPAGRPTKYSEELEKHICDRLRGGSSRKAAVESGGVDYQTFLNWMHENSDFSTAVTRAEAEAQIRYEMRLAKEANDPKGDWKAALEWLKRRRRDEWGDNVAIRADREAAALLAELFPDGAGAGALSPAGGGADEATAEG